MIKTTNTTYVKLLLFLLVLYHSISSCDIASKKLPPHCQRARRLIIEQEGENIPKDEFSIKITIRGKAVNSRIYNDSLYYDCLDGASDSVMTLIINRNSKEYRIDSIYTNIFDMKQKAEIIFGIDIPPFDTKRFGYSEEILSRDPKEIFYLIVNPSEHGIGRIFLGTH